MHAGLRRKHRKSCGVKLSGPGCAIRRAFHIVDQDCTCGKKCFQEALCKWDIDTVVGIIKYCQSEVYGKQYDEKYSIMREKVEGEEKVFYFRNVPHCFNTSSVHIANK